MADKDLTKPTEIEFCTGSFSAVDTAVFKAVGGFDEDYFMYVEDADLTQKMRTRGKAYLVPQYTAIHAWHRAAHRSLKPFLWQLRSLLRYFSPSQCLWLPAPSERGPFGRNKCETEGVSERLFRKIFRKSRSFLLFV